MDPSTTSSSKKGHRSITVNFSNGTTDLVHHSEPPSPGPHQVLIRLLVRPVSPYDIVVVRKPSQLRHIFDSHGQSVVPGFEGYGIVEQIGDGVTEFKPGQRVIPSVWRGNPKENGTWQDYVVVHESKVFPAPDGVSDEAAAQFIANPWTVYGLLDTLSVPKGEYVIQTAAASVLGRMLIQLAKYQGIKTINIIRSEKWRSELKEIGADEVINSETEDVIARVKEITGGKLAHGAIDPVAGTLTKTVGSCVRNGGKVLLIGQLSSSDYTFSTSDAYRGVLVIGWSLYFYVDSDEKEKEVSSKVMELLKDHVITPYLEKLFHWKSLMKRFKNLRNKQEVERCSLWDE